MNAESIMRWLAAVGVPEELVSVDAEADNAWCLLHDEQPDADGVIGWEVFWREQGNRYDWARFGNEQVACLYLFGRLTWAQVVRGAVGVLGEGAAPAPAEPPAPSDEALANADTGPIPIPPAIPEAAPQPAG